MHRDTLLLDYLEKEAALIVLEFDDDERLRKMNSHAAKVMGQGLLGHRAKDIFLDFRETFVLVQAAKEDAAACLLNIPTLSGLPQSCSFTFAELTDGVLAMGQINVAEAETLRLELVRSNNELSNLTRELHKKSAELSKLNAMKNHFLGITAHDLRNPICTIISYSDLMAQEAADSNNPNIVEAFCDIRYLGEFMLSMINDLLDTSAIESGKLTLKTDMQLFSKMLAKTVASNQILAQQVEVGLILEDKLPPGLIPYDAPRLKQVLNNLITNALKFSRKGSNVVVMATLEGEALKVSVGDSGPGIADQDMKRLFQPYPDIGTKGYCKEQGTGLGLAISKNIIHGHQGRIWAQSEIGKGSIFSFTLPGFQEEKI
ncbi:His Kinase A (phospho-acceptor) domain-containing protein [Geoalkalibacter ferrihydriticus]|uniref:histidine kinase n=1 Tax=Geoalkalibacter ferrihydriticus TaxID=392333 RepID=A0A1G9RK84_9BACT|nr:HAMP domain-containing sensor histidine kinase [Geoalkalibacter ferrihydriticus]SDM23327.1 His Kinase A (phospho-acceptor) domain-containing protein [Geoalkalibacter ferrihydriticus]